MKTLLFVVAFWQHSMNVTTIEFSSLEACRKAQRIAEQTIVKLGDRGWAAGQAYDIRSECVELPK